MIQMELRHLRYFIAVAEEGSFSNAAERRLHTAQPSLSRQIRDLELEVGVKLLERKARGIALTAAGRVFLDHARLALLQVEAAGEAARRAEQPEKPGFVVGFLAGQEVVWLSEALRILREEAPDIGITLKQKYDAENLSGGMSLVVSTGGVTLLPLYVQNMLIPSVVARPLQGEPPTIDLVMGYNKSNTSSLLKQFVSRADELVAGVK